MCLFHSFLQPYVTIPCLSASFTHLCVPLHPLCTLWLTLWPSLCTFALFPSMFTPSTLYTPSTSACTHLCPSTTVCTGLSLHTYVASSCFNMSICTPLLFCTPHTCMPPCTSQHTHLFPSTSSACLSVPFWAFWFVEACETVPLNAGWVKMYFAFEFCICLHSSSVKEGKNSVYTEIKKKTVALAHVVRWAVCVQKCSLYLHLDLLWVDGLGGGGLWNGFQRSSQSPFSIGGRRFCEASWLQKDLKVAL